MDETEPRLRAALVETCRAMDRLGLTRGTSGNVSVRLHDGLLVSPTGIPYEALAPDQVVQRNPGGRELGGHVLLEQQPPPPRFSTSP